MRYAVKRDFMARARGRGRTASAVLREFIDGYLAGDSPSEDRPMFKRLAKPATATAVVGAVIAAHVMLPTAAAAAPDFRSVFAQLDNLPQQDVTLNTAITTINAVSGGGGSYADWTKSVESNCDRSRASASF